jgi:hypothetical protein
MGVRFHPHALERMAERGTDESEVKLAVQKGEQFSAKFGRTGFRRNFSFCSEWHGRYYNLKQVEAFAVQEGGEWLVITVITRYF